MFMQHSDLYAAGSSSASESPAPATSTALGMVGDNRGKVYAASELGAIPDASRP